MKTVIVNVLNPKLPHLSGKIPPKLIRLRNISPEAQLSKNDDEGPKPLYKHIAFDIAGN